MLTDLKIEQAKEEYVNAINEINEKYKLPLTIVEMLLDGICNEVHKMKLFNIQKEKEEIKEGEE